MIQHLLPIRRTMPKKTEKNRRTFSETIATCQMPNTPRRLATIGHTTCQRRATKTSRASCSRRSRHTILARQQPRAAPAARNGAGLQLQAATRHLFWHAFAREETTARAYTILANPNTRRNQRERPSTSEQLWEVPSRLMIFLRPITPIAPGTNFLLGSPSHRRALRVLVMVSSPATAASASAPLLFFDRRLILRVIEN